MRGKPSPKKQRSRARKGALQVVRNSDKQVVIVAGARSKPRKSTVKLGISMHPCTATYAAAVADPFSDQALNACVPVGTANTLKACSRSIGRMVIGTAGVGGAFLMPTAYSNVGGCYITNATYTQANLNSNYIVGSQIDLISANRLPFDSNDYQVVNARVVSAGVRVRYVDALATRAGTIDLLVQPDHDSISTGVTGSLIDQTNLTGFPENYHAAITADTYTLNIYAVNQRERDFPSATVDVSNYGFQNGANSTAANVDSGYWYPFGGNDSAPAGSIGDVPYFVPVPNAVVYLRGTPGAQFDIEYIVHVEYVGISATFGATKTESDLDGVLKVCEAAASAAVEYNSDGRTFKQSFANAMIDVFRENLPAAAKAAGNSLMAFLMKGPNARVMSTSLMV